MNQESEEKKLIDLIPSGEGHESAESKGEQAKQPELSRINVETSEEVEGLIGKEIADRMGEGKKGLGDYAMKQGATKAQIQNIKAHLLKNLPPQKVMVREIRQILNLEIREVVKQTKVAEKQKNYHLLNKLFAKLRDLTAKLSDIKDAGFNYIKNLWLKVVHGII